MVTNLQEKHPQCTALVKPLLVSHWSVKWVGQRKSHGHSRFNSWSNMLFISIFICAIYRKEGIYGHLVIKHTRPLAEIYSRFSQMENRFTLIPGTQNVSCSSALRVEVQNVLL